MSTPREILVVDDDKVLADMLVSVLQDANYVPTAMNSGVELLEFLRKTNEAQLVLLDVHMPKMTGVEVVRAVRELRPRHYIILMTGEADPQVAIQCLKLGAEDYISKPLDMDLLLITIERVAERALLRDKNDELRELLAQSGKKPDRVSQAFRRLSHIMRLRGAPRHPERIAVELLDLAHELLESDFSSVLLDRYEGRWSRHVPSASVPASVRHDAEDLLTYVCDMGATLVDGENISGEVFPSPHFQAYPRSVCVPVRQGEIGLGAIQVSRTGRRPFAQEDINVLEVLCSQLGIMQSNATLYENFEKLTIGAMQALGNALRHKDCGTADHSDRSKKYVEKAIQKLSLPKYESDMISFAMQLHDIGKIRVPGEIINKPGPLTDEEWAIMRMHPVWGYEILNSDGMLTDVALLVRHHHERYDGKGYPDGLEGPSIPLGSRLLCLADSFDAMTSNRSYRRALPLDRCISEILANLGSQFDPEVGQVFIEAIGESQNAPRFAGAAHEDAEASVLLN